jgi:two-component system, chemotaxis family, CheB/CheR fusion protein
MTAGQDAAFFEHILDHLRQTRGFDFTAYKRTSLMRRLMKRMAAVNITSFEQYLDYLQVHQDEFATLFDTILINVTSFFRDPEVWEYLASDVLPRIVAERAQDGIRIWSAGSASGQEAYTIAMLLAERIGVEALRERVKIYATDVDDAALAQARQAVYASRTVEEIPAALLEKYFEKTGSDYTFSRDLRRVVIFGRHDLIQDAPISRVDLLLCRNTLMYFNADTQARILAKFYFSVNSGGFLLLGRAEMLFSHAAMFAPVDLKKRLFRAVPRSNQRDRLLMLAQTGRDALAHAGTDHTRLREAAFDADNVPQLILDATAIVVAANTAARQQFGLSHEDLGQPLRDLEISYRPAELRGALNRALDERREFVLKNISWSVNGEPRVYDIGVVPLYEDDHAALGTRISFVDVTVYRALQDELRTSKEELETAYEELQSTNEELETTNEELQSTVEELETTNEELQSTNEELETMNEELQSTNEELQTINDELRNRSTDLNAANSFLESVFTSLRSAVVVLDREFRVHVWNHRAEDLWGVRPDEASQGSFMSLDIGLPVSELGASIRSVLRGDQEHVEITQPATNRRGKPFECRISISPLRRGDRTIEGAILLMEEVSYELE